MQQQAHVACSGCAASSSSMAEIVQGTKSMRVWHMLLSCHRVRTNLLSAASHACMDV